MSSSQSDVDNVDVPAIVVEQGSYAPALVVVDMQNDFIYGSLAVPESETILPVVNALIELPFKAKIATRDFHPDNHISFAKTHQKSEYSTVDIYHPADEQKTLGVEQILWPTHCVADSHGAEFVAGLKQDFDAVVHKGTHPSIESYSAFRDVWGKCETELPQILREVGATDVYFCGLAGDYCIKYSALDAIDYGYNTWVIRDAVKSISQNAAAWEEMERKGVKFVDFVDVKEKLQRSAEM